MSVLLLCWLINLQHEHTDCHARCPPCYRPHLKMTRSADVMWFCRESGGTITVIANYYFYSDAEELPENRKASNQWALRHLLTGPTAPATLFYWHTINVSLCLFCCCLVSLSVCYSVFVTLSVCLPVSLLCCLCHPVCLSLCLLFCLCHPVCPSVILLVFLPRILSVFLSLFLIWSIFLSFCLSYFYILSVCHSGFFFSILSCLSGI